MTENPYTGLAGLLWAHGEEEKARQASEYFNGTGPRPDWFEPPVITLDRLIDATPLPEVQLFKEPGTLVASGGWCTPSDRAFDFDSKVSYASTVTGQFPSRCTNCNGVGVRCHLEYAHPGDHQYTCTAILKRKLPAMTDHELPPKHTSKAGQTRIIANDTVEKFLNEKIQNIHEQIQFIDNQLAEHEEKKAAMQRTRAALRHDENEIHEALATLKSVRARNHGESHEGS